MYSFMWFLGLGFGSLVIGTILAAMFPERLPNGLRANPLPRVLKLSLVVALTWFLLYAMVALAARCSAA